MAAPPRARIVRTARAVVGLLVVTLVLGAVGIVVAVGVLQGPRMGWLAARLLPKMAGQITLGGGRCGLGDLVALLTERPAAIALDDLRIVDPEGTVVLQAAHLTARLQILRHPTQIIISDLRPGKAVWRYARMKNHRGLGFLAAFASPVPAATRAPARRPPSAFLFQIASAELDGLDASFDFPTWGLDLGDVKGRGSLLADARDPAHPRFLFSVDDVDARSGGGLRMLDGARSARLPFERAYLGTIGITAAQPTDLQLVVTAAMTGRSPGGSRLSGGGAFTDLFGSSAPGRLPGLRMDVALDAPGEALAAIGVGTRFGPVRVVGDGGQLRVHLEGPFNHLTATGTGRDLTIEHAARPGRPLGQLQLDAAASLAPLQVTLRQLQLLTPGGGRAQISAQVNSALELQGDLRVSRVDTTDYLPPYLRGLAAGVLDGHVQLQVGLASGAAELRALDLSLERPAGAPPPRVIRVVGGDGGGTRSGRRARTSGVTVQVPALTFADGALSVRHLAGAAFGGRVSIDGQLRFWRGQPLVLLPSPEVTLVVRADGVQLDRARLRPLLGGTLNLTARAQGTLDRLAVDLRLLPSSRLTILDQAYAAAAPVHVRVEDRTLIIPALPLVQVGGGQSRIDLRGQVAASGQLDLQLSVTDRQLATLPGLVGAGLPLGGRVDAHLHLRGALAEPALAGDVALKDVALAGRLLGDGALTLTAAGPRAVGVRGRLFQTFTLEGTLADRPAGPALNLALTLDRTALGPLLPDLPPFTGGQATASGRVTMDIGPGRPVAFDARFTELALSYQLPAPPRRAVTAAPRVGIHSTGPVDVHMTGWGTRLVLDEAGFDFGAGSLRAAGTVVAGVLAASARGPIDLGRLAPVVDALLPGVVEGLGGTALADVRLVGPLTAPRVQGRLQITRPWQAALPILPGARVTVASGTLVLDDPGALSLQGLSAQVSYGGPSALATGQGTIRVDARLTGLRGGRPRLTAEASIPAADLTVPALGETLALRDVRLTASDDRLTLHSLQATSQHHGRFTVGGDGAPPGTAVVASLQPLQLGAVDVPVSGRAIAYGPSQGLKIDEMDLSLRVRGDARRQLIISGDVDLRAGRFAVDGGGAAAAARKPAAKAGPPAKRRPGPLDQIALDVRVRSDGQRFAVQHRYVPDLKLRLDLHAGGTAAAPKITAASGSGLGATDVYGWLVLLFVNPFR